MSDLINSAGLDFSSINSEATNLQELLKDIEYEDIKEVDVIILERTSASLWETFFTSLFATIPGLILIIISEENNWLQIYRREDFLMTSAADLITVIQSI